MINMSCSRVMFEMKFGKPEDDAPQFVLKECEQYQEGTFSIQMSFFRGKVYCHLQNNKKGTQTSFPLDVMLALWGIREDLQAAADTLTQLAGPPSPPLIPITPIKKRRVVMRKRPQINDDEDEDDILAI
ncbi:uncharacterized protein LOC144624384 [Crassostrea virginica]